MPVARRPAVIWGVALVGLLAVVGALVPALVSAGPGGDDGEGRPAIAQRPPIGWTSWSSLHGNISEAIIEAEAQVIHDNLREHGYVYVNIDSGWTDHLDAYGRHTWNTTKFPDGIPAVAAFVHRLGLKLGIYLLPGIPKDAVAANTPILGTPYHAQDIADTTTDGNTYIDSWRIDYNKPGAESYVQSYADLLASWGVDYLKFDFVGPGGGHHPADNRADIEHWHYALQHSGRPIHLELSNSLSIGAAATWKAFANGWRIEGDVECYSHCPGHLTDWTTRVVRRFTDVPQWIQYASPGGWNDLDSLELGNGDRDGLTPDERVSTMTLWAIEAAPLLLGTDLRNLDAQDLQLMTNDEVIRVDQEGLPAHPISQAAPQQVWFSKEPRGSYVVALFNLDAVTAPVTINWSDLGLTGKVQARDLWSHEPVATGATGFTATLAPHASRLLRVGPAED